VDACLLTGSQGLADPAAAQAWAGLEDASQATTARVSYLAVTGPATEAGAQPFAGTLLVRGCDVVVASGAAERAALLAEAPQFSSVRFVVDGAAAGSPSNVTALAFATSGLRAGVASAVEADVRAAGG
jgi:basic membrane lipoprotein Med (substrate-binding protein (PBP1-ABC) superfamily)